MRQVHLLQRELFDELAVEGHEVGPGELGENVTTSGIDLLSLPLGTRLRLGDAAEVELTGLRNPCVQIDRFQPGLMRRMIRESSNEASTELMTRVGKEYIARVLLSPRYRLYDPRHNGGLWVGKDYASAGLWRRDPLHNLSHGATAMQVARFYYLLETGNLVTPEHSLMMKEILAHTALSHKFVASLRKMQLLNAQLMCCGHGPAVKEPNRKLQELIDHRQQREDQVLALVRDGKDTVKALVKAIYPELDKRLLGMAQGQTRSHLAKLASEGKVRMTGEGDDMRVEMV